MPPANNLSSRFFDYLLENNRAALAGFKGWHFLPGMSFQAGETWWGEKKPRSRPHEGLDLGCFEDAGGLIRHLDKQIKIPAAFAGKIIKIDRDFLGKSIYLGHAIFSPDGRQLYTAYGHTRPLPSIKVGQELEEGEIIAVVAAPLLTPNRIPPHLHLTFAWVPAAIAPARLTWQNLGNDPAITLIDPLTILAAPV